MNGSGLNHSVGLKLEIVITIIGSSLSFIFEMDFLY